MTQSSTNSFMRQTEPSGYKMETAQSMMDTKNLGIIQDQMHHEALAYKKSRIYSEILSEQPLKDMANRFAQHHKQHFDALQNYLDSHQ